MQSRDAAQPALLSPRRVSPGAAADADPSGNRASLYPLLCSLFLLLGFGLRLVLLDAYPLREDEAIYSYWALHALHVDPLYLTVWPDKPPVFLWTLAGAFALFGETAPAARMVNILAGTLTIAVLAAVARRLWSPGAGVGAAALAALSPYAVSFAPTALTDPLLVLAGSLALLCAVCGRAVWAGVWLGAAIMTKQPGVLFIPLIAGALWLTGRQSGGNLRRMLLRACLGGLAVIAPVLIWDSLRWAVAPSPWDLGGRNYGALHLLTPGQWPARGRAWVALAALNLPDSRLWLLYGGSVCLAFGWALWHASRRRLGFPLLLGGWGLGWIFLHVASTVPVWDRYLLPLTIPLVLLGGWAVGVLLEERTAGSTLPATRRRLQRLGPALVGLAVLLVLPSALAAARGDLPLGSDHGAYVGFEELVAAVPAAHAAGESASPDAGERAIVLYHDALGWLLQFYLFDAVSAGRIELRWFSSSTYLADNMEKVPHARKFYLAADWARDADFEPALARRGLAPVERGRAGHFTLYEISPARQAACDWCRCVPAVPWTVLDLSTEPAPAKPVHAAGVAGPANWN